MIQTPNRGASEPGSRSAPANDSGVAALAFILRLLGLPADELRIRHDAGTREALQTTDLLRAARRFPVKAKVIERDLQTLPTAPLPALASRKDGRWWIVGSVSADEVLVQDPAAAQPEILPIADFAAEWTGQLLLVVRRAELGDPLRRFGLGWFVDAVAKYRKPMTEVLVASFFVQVLALVMPLFFQAMVDKVLVHRGLSTLAVLAVGMALLSIFEVLLSGLRAWLFAHTTNRIDVELSSRLFRHLMSLPLAYFGSRRIGDTVARVRELDTIRQFLTSSALTLVLDLLFGVVFLAVLFAYSPSLALIVLLSLPAYVVLSVLATPMFHRRIEEMFKRGAENQALLVESVSGIETIKAMALEPVLQRRWEEQAAAHVTSAFRVNTLATWAQHLTTAINKAVTVALLYFGARAVMRGELTVGELVAFNMLAGQVSAPVLRLAQIWQDFQQARVSIDRLGDILNTLPEPMPQGPSNGSVIEGNIRFEGVGFRYRANGAPVLADVNVHIPAGQVVGIVGASGSGKSTLVKLVQRFFVPDEGRVLIDGLDLAQADPVWLRRQLGVVLQENVLFNRSVRENIALANPAMSMEEVIAAARLAGAHDFIVRLPQAYDTVVGERGTSLSGGQRQRIAIARALAVRPRILILDEATSALDYESEAAIRANMQAICQGRTVLIVAHRLSTVRNADRILVFEDGRLIQDGSHEQLLVLGGRYARLHALQGGTQHAA